MRMVSSHAPIRAPRVFLTAAVCVALACLAWSAPALAASAPTVEEEFTTNVASNSATLQAKVNPGGEETTYRFEYGTTEAYGSSAPVPDGLVGSGESATPVQAHVQGLAAHTTYHYRVVARSALGTAAGEDLTFTTQTTGGELALPDNRQWEMVSPPDKRGALLEAISELGLDVASAGGEAIAYVSRLPLEAEPLGFAYTVQNLSVRGPAGWRSRSLTVPHGGIAGGSAVGKGPEYRFFSSDLSHAIVQPLGPFTPCRLAEGAEQPCMSPEASEQTAFLTTDFDGAVGEPCMPRSMGCARPLVSGCPKAGEACAPVVAEHANVPAGTVFGGWGGGELELTGKCKEGGINCGPYFVAASPDLSHVVFEAGATLTPGAPSTPDVPTSHDLYEWSAGKLTFIGVGVIGDLQSEEPGVSPVSDDGSRVVFAGASEGLDGLLMRDTATGETVNVGPGLAGTPSFQAASASGSRVFLADGGELYVFEVSEKGGPLTGTLSDLTSGAGVEGNVLGVSEDGSDVYFVSGGVLAGSGATSPGDNLYVDRYDGAEWKPTFIVALSGEDYLDWGEQRVGSTYFPVDETDQPTRVSPNGEWLAFMSQAPLTGYDNRDELNGRPDAEVYLYSAAANRVVCASCNPTGARPIGVEEDTLTLGGRGGGLEGDQVWPIRDWVAANVQGRQHLDGGLPPEGYQSRYLSNAGRLFFDSSDALVPQDVNGADDVYEYEPAGVGGCEDSLATYSVLSGGCVGLISSGISPEESVFLDASESGGDVFFLSSAKLVPQDVEASLSLYDARECTAQSPCVSAPVSRPPCETEASCRPAPSPQPAVFGAPASATLAGGGNVTSSVSVSPAAKKTAGRKAPGKRGCAKGRRRRRGRCMRVRDGRASRTGSVKRVGRGR